MIVRPDDMVGVQANVLARLVWHALLNFDTANPPPKLKASIHDALFALDLDTNIEHHGALTELMK